MCDTWVGFGLHLDWLGLHLDWIEIVTVDCIQSGLRLYLDCVRSYTWVDWIVLGLQLDVLA